MKEPWDYAEFVRCYNSLARARAGNDFDGLLTPGELEQNYKVSTAMTIREFAEGRFALDQEY
jgi:hypothetical protein